VGEALDNLTARPDVLAGWLVDSAADSAAVPDVEASLAKAESLGGTRVMGPEKVMDMVELGLFKDPEGHVIGVVKDDM